MQIDTINQERTYDEHQDVPRMPSHLSEKGLGRGMGTSRTALALCLTSLVTAGCDRGNTRTFYGDDDSATEDDCFIRLAEETQGGTFEPGALGDLEFVATDIEAMAGSSNPSILISTGLSDIGFPPFAFETTRFLGVLEGARSDRITRIIATVEGDCTVTVSFVPYAEEEDTLSYRPDLAAQAFAYETRNQYELHDETLSVSAPTATPHVAEGVKLEVSEYDN